ncbi:MAG: hypothetical protein DMF87_11515 [Acidobacteria bacterium]|nr:MAG: hypothetical protein DMF87_11515 [Acidobacteriota bacterium]
MRILFAALHNGYYRNIESVVDALAARGHDIFLAAERPDSALGGQSIVERLGAKYRNVAYGEAPHREQKTRFLASKVRLTLDFLRYLEPEYAGTPALHRRASVRTPSGFVWLADHGLLASRASRRMLARALHAIDRTISPSPDIERFLDRQRPDAVVITPLVGLVPSSQLDLLRSAQARRVPTAVCVWSWDHLSSKAIIRDIPDRLFVWNDVQRTEAIEMHRVPADRVVVTGAHSFDRWFDQQPSRNRVDFCRRVGLPDDRPFVLWVCSALFPGSPSEAQFVLKWAAALRASSDERLRNAAILVRPHPSRKRDWDDVEWRGIPNVTMWGDNPIDAESRADYFDSLCYSAAVAGLNTSAFIEAGVVGRPVLAILPDEFRSNQEGTLHFHYLVDGGLLTVSRSLDEHASQLSAVLRGDDADVLARVGQFVRSFVRPLGLDVRATDVMADAVEDLARMAPAGAAEQSSASGRLGLAALRMLERVPLGRRLLLNEREVEGKRRRAEIEGREVSWL